MGFGDEMIASGQAKKLHRITGKQIAILDARGRSRWHMLWEGLPFIARAIAPDCEPMVNGPNARPYIASKTSTRWTWKRFDLRPGELYFAPHEREFGEAHGGMVMIEPNVKANQHANKAWPWARWQALVDTRVASFVQCGPPGTRWLENVRRVQTADFRFACAVLASSAGFVGTEGGLHHAAAALGKPAVVLFSEFIGADITGYQNHANLRHAGEACGSRLPCRGCAVSMEAITTEEVIDHVAETLH